MNLDFVKTAIKKGDYKKEVSIPGSIVSPKAHVGNLLFAEKEAQKDICVPSTKQELTTAGGCPNDKLITSNDSTQLQTKSFAKKVVHEKLKKALSAGYGYAGPPGQLSGGSALMGESLAEKNPKLISIGRAPCPGCARVTPHLNTYQNDKKDTMCLDCLTETPVKKEDVDSLKKEIAKKAFVYSVQKAKDKDEALRIFKAALPSLFKAEYATLGIGETKSGRRSKWLFLLLVKKMLIIMIKYSKIIRNFLLKRTKLQLTII